MSNKLPDELLCCLRGRKLAEGQKHALRDLAETTSEKPKSAIEYAQMYARRMSRITSLLKTHRE